MHERGEITDEYYESIVQIRSMSEEDWKEIVKDYNNGNLDKEQYEAMKQIREMPDDWRTLENGLKGITNGTANGLWEGVQWYLGGKLGDFAIQGHKILSSSVRVGIDSAFNAADTPYRAFIDAATSDGNFDAAWANQGGWESVLSNLAVGLVGSVGGEIFDNVKLNKKNIDIHTQEPLIEDFGSGRINLDSMPAEQVDSIIRQKIDGRGYYNDTDYRFQYQYEATGSYGCNQGGIANILKYETIYGDIIDYNSPAYYDCVAKGIGVRKVTTSQDYLDIKDNLVKKYRMTKQDASTILSGLDTVGACSYASEVNDIISFFSKDSARLAEFEEKFGFPLYKKNSFGVYELNDKELLADMYIWCNTNRGAYLLYTDPQGNLCVNYNNITRDANGNSVLNGSDSQNYLMFARIEDGLINDYFKSKGLQYTYKSKDIYNCTSKNAPILTDKKMNSIIEKAKRYMDNGYELQCRIIQNPNSPVRFIDTDTGEIISTAYWHEGGAHAVKITGIDQNGLIVSTWGQRMIIPFDDLQRSGWFSIFAGEYK